MKRLATIAPKCADVHPVFGTCGEPEQSARHTNAYGHAFVPTATPVSPRRPARILVALALALTVATSALAVTPRPVVNVNTATAEQLQHLPYVGVVIAARIIDFLDCGEANVADRVPITSVDALLAVRGIGPAKLAAMRPYIVLTGQTTATTKIKATKVATPKDSAPR